MTNTSRQVLAICLLSSAGLLAGCGRGDEPIPADADVRNPNVYGSMIKSNAIPMLTQAKKQPARAAAIASQLAELVEDYETRPVGEHADKYKSFRNGAKELKDLADKSSPDVKKKIDELIAVAESLPGELKLMGDELKGTNQPKDLDDR